MIRFLLFNLPIFIVMWVLMLLIKIPTALLGAIMVPLLYPIRNTLYEDLPFWTRPWANPEDWEGPGFGEQSLPMWWVLSKGTGFWSFYKYHAVRNPANGLRSFEWLDLDIVPHKVEFRRSKNYTQLRYDVHRIREQGLSTVWYFAWQGFRAGFHIVHIWNSERHLNILIGWRVEPSDLVTENDNIGIHDASFASKILLWREG